MKPGEIHHGYRLEGVLGSGARANVWEATQLVSGQRYALKVLETTAIGADARFLQEFKVQAELKHPNIVHVHAFLEIERRLVFVCDLVQGPDLQELLAESPPSRQQALRLFADVLRGLQAAHDAGLVHRDLKPSNVIVSLEDPQMARITDFGEVKTTSGPGLSDEGMVLGTMRYMPPEQLQDASDVDPRADLFAAGCILYELLTGGDKAFDAPNMIAVMNKIRLGEHQPIPEDLPEATRTMLERMLSPDRDQRPSSANEVLEALGMPLEAPVSVSDAPFTRQEAPRVLMAGAAIVGLIALAIASFVLLNIGG